MPKKIPALLAVLTAVALTAHAGPPVGAVALQMSIHDAAKTGPDEVRDALARSDANALDPGDGNALHAALYWRHNPENRAEVVRLLLEAGADPAHPDRHGVTPFHMGLQHGEAIADMMLAEMESRGEPLNTLDGRGYSPLFWAIDHPGRPSDRDSVNSRVVGRLLAAGADPDITGENRPTPRARARSLAADNSEIQKVVEIMEDDFRNELETPNRDGDTPLIVAAVKQQPVEDLHETNISWDLQGRLDRIDYLLDLGADINGKNSRDGSTALHKSALGRADVRIVEHLLDNDADVNARNNRGDTPLYMAVLGTFGPGDAVNETQESSAAIVRALLAAGADPTLTNNRGDSALCLFAVGRLDVRGFDEWHAIASSLLKNQANCR